MRLVQAPTRYLAANLPGFDEIPRDDLRKNLAVWAVQSGEAGSTPRAEEGARAAGGAPAGDGVLARFATNLTERAKERGKLDPVFGRERPRSRQSGQMFCAGAERTTRSSWGSPGVGKTALVEGLALRIAAGDVPAQLREVQVHVLDLGALQAGAGVKGEFENRLRGVITEVKASPKPIVLFIDEAHTIIGAGGPQGARGRGKPSSSLPARAASCGRSRRRPGPSPSATARRTRRSCVACRRCGSKSRRSIRRSG